MSTLSVARRSFPRRCALVLLLVGGLAACTSSRNDGAGPAESGVPADSTAPDPTGDTGAGSTTTTSTTTTLPPTTTTIEIVTVGGVVKVANASGVDGAAGRLTEELAALGFETRDPTNAAGPDGDLPTSKVYVRSGSEAVAASVAALMGGLEIFPMPTPAWIQGAMEELADATVLVMLGHDLAGTPLSAMTG